MKNDLTDGERKHVAFLMRQTTRSDKSVVPPWWGEQQISIAGKNSRDGASSLPDAGPPSAFQHQNDSSCGGCSFNLHASAAHLREKADVSPWRNRSAPSLRKVRLRVRRAAEGTADPLKADRGKVAFRAWRWVGGCRGRWVS